MYVYIYIYICFTQDDPAATGQWTAQIYQRSPEDTAAKLPEIWKGCQIIMSVANLHAAHLWAPPWPPCALSSPLRLCLWPQRGCPLRHKLVAVVLGAPEGGRMHSRCP